MNAAAAFLRESAPNDRFVLKQVVGRGRTATVYRALDLATRSEVALKVLDPFLIQDAAAVDRFRREVSILRTVSHPNIVGVFDLLEIDEYTIIVLELVAGGNARQHLDTHGPLPLRQFIHVARALAEALKTCHRRGVLHRDIKPQNLLVDARGEFRLVDFGVAQFAGSSGSTMTGAAFGTPAYMAPEQLSGRSPDQRSEVYSFAATCYELMTGRRPYPGMSMPEVLREQAAGPPLSPSFHRDDLPEWISTLVLSCLNPDPDQRPQGFGEILASLAAEGVSPTAASARARDCIHCGKPSFAGMPYCTSCGRSRPDQVGTGTSSLVVQKHGDKAAADEYLRGLFEVRRTTLASPRVLVRGIDEHSARRIALDLSPLGYELRIVSSVISQASIHPLLYFIALFLVCMIPLGPTFVARIFMTAAALVTLLLLHRAFARPLCEVSARGVALPWHRHIDGLRPLVLDVSEPTLRALAGRLASAYCRYLEGLESLGGTRPLDGAGLAVREGLAHLKRMEQDILYLQSRTSTEIRDKIEAVDFRIRRESDVIAIARLIDEKQVLERDLSHYRLVDESFRRRQVAVLNLHDVLVGNADAGDDESWRRYGADLALVTAAMDGRQTDGTTR